LMQTSGPVSGSGGMAELPGSADAPRPMPRRR
jgi:hypothetical protein